MNWHTLSIPQTYQNLDAGPDGLTTQTAELKIQQYGPNQLTEGRGQGWPLILLGQFKDFMILLLIAAAVISGVIGDITDTIVILVIVILNAMLAFFQQLHATKALLALKNMNIVMASVLRDGQWQSMPASTLVPGDIVLLQTGDAIPADIRLTRTIDLKIQEAALTGESHDTEKNAHTIGDTLLPPGDRINMAFKGTFVTAGKAEGIVVATGMHTELGRIAGMLQRKESPTPLQKRMQQFGKKLTLIIVVLCAGFVVARLLIGDAPGKIFLTGISLAVAVIPEALPAVIAISLAIAAKNMIRYHCLIRKLPAVETLGSVTHICTDKTGTITRNKMEVVEIYTGGRTYRGEEWPLLKNEPASLLLLQALACNNDTLLNGQQRTAKDSTETALGELVTALGVDNKDMPRLTELSFDAQRKLMTTFHPQHDKIIAFTKGAPDLLLRKLARNDNDNDPDPILRQIEEMAARGRRVIGFAYRIWDELPLQPNPDHHEKELHFLGLAGISDAPRPEIKDAVIQCRKAGIVPIIITGDHPLTAKDIAQQTGILQDDRDTIMTGLQLDKMNDTELTAAADHIRIYARVSPEQKFRIVETLQKKGYFVAMTGDGVNDAPSLKKADIGIAMGITGADVTKEAADMILLDDNFTTIVHAVREGRRIYDNILKFIKYLMTSNIGELVTLVIGPLLGLPIALLPIHILWINLVTDGLPAICLSFEKADPDIMDRPPRPPHETVFANGRGAHIAWVGILMSAVSLAAQSIAIRYHMHWQTIVFNVLCLSQMGHVLAIRSSRSSFAAGTFSNWPLLASVLLTCLLQAGITFIPSLHFVFKTQSLDIGELALVSIASAIVFLTLECQKWLSPYFSAPAGIASKGTLV